MVSNQGNNNKTLLYDTKCDQDEIADFLERVNIVDGDNGIIILTDDRSRPSGDAYVEVESMDDVDQALKMHKRDMGRRLVEWGCGVGRGELWGL